MDNGKEGDAFRARKFGDRGIEWDAQPIRTGGLRFGVDSLEAQCLEVQCGASSESPRYLAQNRSSSLRCALRAPASALAG